MQKLCNNTVSAKYCGTVCDSASIPQTYTGSSVSDTVPVDRSEMHKNESLMSSDNMSWLDDSVSENKEALRLLSE
jgi:hypothetical protein